MGLLVLACSSAVASDVFSTAANLDIGTCQKPGSETYNPTTDVYTVKGSGADIWGTSDNFHYCYQPLEGDGVIVARVASMTAYANSTSAVTTINSWAKVGVMIRESLDANSAYAMMMVTPGNNVGIQYRKGLGGSSYNVMSGAYASFHWIKLERHGNLLTAYRSADGLSWVFAYATVINFSPNVYIGLAVTSHSTGAYVTAAFDHVSVTASDVNMALPWPWAESSLGAAADPGVAMYDTDTAGYFVSNLGADIWGRADRLKYVSQSLEGDGTITVKVLANSSADWWTRVGLMMRESLDENARNVLVASTTGYGVVFQSRQATGGGTAFRATAVSKAAPVWLRLARSGNVFTASYSLDDGLTWTVQGTETVAMTATIQVGLAYSNHSSIWSFGQAERLKLTTPLDTDGNGLPDVWETLNGQTGVATSADPDGDTLTNAQEWKLGTDPDTFTPPGQVPVLTVVGGDNQTGLPNTVLPQPLKVKVTNARTGEILSGIVVHFRLVTGQGALSDQQTLGITTQVSDANGEAQVDFTLPSSGGPNVIQAWLGDKASVVSLTERALLGETATSSILLDAQDIGAFTLPGKVLYSGGTYTMSAATGDVWGGADSNNYVYQNLSGDGLFVARVASVDPTHVWAKAGLMIRESLDANARNAMVAVTPGRGATFQWRTVTGGSCSYSHLGGVTAPQWLALRRSGDVIAGYCSADGHTWTQVGRCRLAVGQSLYVGLSYSSISKTYGQSVFDSVSLSPLAPAPWTVADIGLFNAGNIDEFAADSLRIRGCGVDIWGASDSFRYVYQPLPADGRMVVRVAELANTNAWGKSGLMVRDGTYANARFVLLALTPGNGVTLQARAKTGASAYIVTTNTGFTAPVWLKLERFGSNVDAYQSSDGQAWTKVGSVAWGTGSALLGLATSSHATSANANALFDRVGVDLFDNSRGWSATYFDGANLDTQRAARRDQTIDFQWAAGTVPASGVTTTAYSAHWEGVLRPQYSETYTFTLRSNGGVRLWVNDQAVVNDWTAADSVRDVTGQIALTAGVDVRVRVEYFNPGGAGTVQLRWSSDSLADQPVPLGSVRPTDTDNDGLPDDWELSNGLNPRDGSDASASSSGDGLSNLFKYQNNLNPAGHYEKRDGLVVVEQWQNLSGGYISNLTAAAAFPTQPTTRWLLKDALEVPSIGDRYGLRIRGYIKAPTTGVYKFWISGDDESAFWLSPSENPYDRVKVAYSASWTNFRQFDLRSTQASKGITLRAGDYYYFEVLQKEGGGGDHVSVAWQVPNSTAGRVLIPLSNLASFSLRADTTVPAGSLALGADYSLALSGTGTVRAWGGNAYGQLGDATLTDRISPVAAGGVSLVGSVSAGAAHSVAVRTDGLLYTWGNNARGQLGDNGTSAQRSSAFTVAAFTTSNRAVSASAGGAHTLACTADGKVWSWGDNSKGQLGVATSTAMRSLPAQVSGLTDVISVAAGDLHSLALKTDGTVWAWGDNTDGQLGDGTTTLRTAPVQVAGLSDIVQVSAGTNFSVARRADGTVWAWGRNDAGQLGDGSTTARAVAVQVQGLSSVWSVCAGDTHALALKSDGSVWGWGSNTKGELGSTLPLLRTVPAPVLSAANGVALGAGLHRSGFVDTTGAVHCWGDNEGGRLGNSTQAYRVSPAGLTDTKKAAFLYAGGNHAFVQRLNGKLFAWGANDHGQLAVGNKEPASVPSPVYDNAVFRNTSAIAVGARHTLILAQGSVVAAGDNASGQLGDGTHVDNIGVWLTDLGANVTSVAAGDRHSLAVKDDGTVWGWGSNDHGQLGLGAGAPAASTTPVQVPALTHVVAVAAGDTHSLALKDDGTVWAWGDNSSGQLGNGTTVQKNAPTLVPFAVGVRIAAIAAGRAHSLFLSAADSSYYPRYVCVCGDNSRGQIGNNSATDQAYPVLVNVPGVTAIAAGADHSIILLSDGSIRCWGRNDRGQIGNGSTADRDTPYATPISYDSADVIAVAANAAATYALLKDGTVAVWGDDSAYQLGYDSGRSALLPLRLKTWAADTDANGLSDAWEAQHSAGSPLSDLDFDGLLNIEEYDRGTDPRMVDTDGDLVTDFADTSLSPLNAESLSVIVLGGDNQVAAPGQFNAAAFDVAFWDDEGNAPQVQLPATFAVLNSSGLISTSATGATGLSTTLALKTDADGSVQAWFRQPAAAGENSYVRVRVAAETYDFQTFSASTTTPSSGDGDDTSDSLPVPDSDGDGVVDSVEQAMGTDPHDSGSTPQVQVSTDLNLLLLTP